MRIPVGSGSTGNSDESILYPIDLMRQVAAKLLVQADVAQQEHDRIYAQVQSFLEANDVDGTMAAVVKPHAQRMRDSYEWQIQLASTLFDAIDAMENTDQNVSQRFTPTHGFARPQ
jgi:hypothetical protein